MDSRRIGYQFPGGARDIAILSVGLDQSPIKSVPSAFSPRVRHTGLEADYSPHSSTKVKNAWSYTYIVPYVFTA
jgi:hypothetical protein